MPDIERPFCPLPRGKLFFNVSKQRDEIDKIIDRLSAIFAIVAKKTNIPGSITGAAIFSGVEALKGNGGRVLVFSANSCLNGIGHCRPRDDRALTLPDKEKSLYIPQTNVYIKLGEVCNKERTAVDLFVIGNNQFDFPTLSSISNITGGKATFYSVMNTKENPHDLNQKLEKLHYDLSRILSRQNYYDVRFMLRYGLGVQVQEIIGQFGRKHGQAFAQASMDPDLSFTYHLQLIEKLTVNYNTSYLRVFNVSYEVESDISKLYYQVDVDAMTKLIAQKELLYFYSNQIEKIPIRENIEKKIVQMLYFYRKKCSDKSPVQQLILPASVKFIPLFLTSLLKKTFLRKNKDHVSSNLAMSQLIKIMRDPLGPFIKYLYPKFYRLDDIQEDQSDKVDDPENVLVS
jgi:hypothetical protein